MTEPTPKIIMAGLDIESTGLDQADGHRIIEIAIEFRELATGARVGSFVSRVNPERSIDPDAQAVHGIGFEALAHEPTWNKVAPKVSTLLRRAHHIVAHNGDGFDLPFVYAELLREGQPLPSQAGLVDTMLQGRWATPDGALPNLGALAFASGVPYDKSKAHAALYDVEVMMDCFFMHLPRGFFQLPTQPWAFKPPVSKKKAKA